MTVIRIRYKSTNCYFIDTGGGLLAFDAGLAGIRGQVLHTNGHGEQSISLLLDKGRNTSNQLMQMNIR